MASPSCPICSCGTSHLRFEVSADAAARHFIVKGANPKRHAALAVHLVELWHGDNCSVRECDACGFCYADPFVAGDARYYGLAYEAHRYPRWRWEYDISGEKIRAALVARNVSTPRLLEIGAGEGNFVKTMCPSLFRPENVACLEYSDFGAERLRKLGVAVMQDSVLNMTDSGVGSPFSVVCMFQVLEHMDQIDSVLEKLHQITDRKADLFISTPNDGIIDFYERNGCLLDMPPNHISRWNRNAFATLAERNGWRLVEHLKSPRSFFHLWKQIAHYRYLRQRQSDGTVSDGVSRVRNRRLRRCLEVCMVAYQALAALPLFPLMASPALGFTQWAHLKKM